MSYQDQWIKGALNIARVSFESGMKSMEIFPKQAEKAIELTVSNANIMQNEAQKVVSTCLENMKEARTLYVDAIDQGMSTLEQQVKKQAKSQ